MRWGKKEVVKIERPAESGGPLVVVSTLGTLFKGGCRYLCGPDRYYFQVLRILIGGVSSMVGYLLIPRFLLAS